MPVAGYPSATSVIQGEYISLHISADPEEQVQVDVYRVGGTERTVFSVTVPAGPQRVPPDGAQLGFGWPTTTSVPVAIDWPSGLYRVELSTASGGKAAPFHFVVRAIEPGASARVLLMYPATTCQAYNAAGGASLYEFNSPGGVPVNQVSFDRPGGLDYWREAPFAGWFEGAGVATEACTNVDVHSDPSLVSNYQLVVSMGHDEYWSREMRDAVEDFVTRGGNVAFFSGNVCWWQIRFENDNRIMVCYKDAAADPLTGVDDSRVTVNWADAPVFRPENGLTGVGWRTGAQVDGAGTGYVCRFAGHWVFDGTGLVDGQTFGETFIGYETDACDFIEVAGIPRATGRDGTPPSFVILATADYSRLAVPSPGYATMGLYRRGGTVFTAAATDWGLGLAAASPHLATITRNVVTRLANRVPGAAWQHIGEAIDVVAMAATGGQLFAATKDGRLWQREAVGQNLHWTDIGDAAGIVAMGASGYAKWTEQAKLYAVSANDELLWRDPVPGAGWALIGSANGCVAIAVTNVNSRLLGVDSSHTLWSRELGQGASWNQLGPVGVAVRSLAAHYRSVVACDRYERLWRRDAQLNSSWAPLGAAVGQLTAMAVTQGALFAATADGRLWQRDLLGLSAAVP